jgi:hypothetical protein
MKVKSPPKCSLYKYIYSGDHLNSDNLLEDRVMFCIPFYVEAGSIIYFTFPLSGSDSECKEERYNLGDLML